MSDKLGSKLKELRETASMSAKEVSVRLRELGFEIHEKTIYGYESGIRMPNADVFMSLCHIYNCKNILETFGTIEVDYSIPDDKEWKMIEQYRKLDSYGVDLVDTVLEKEFVRCTKTVRKTHVYTYYRRIACAGDGFLFDDIPPESIEAPECQNADFIIGVNGDSMEPTFCDGDLVYVRRTEDIKTGKCGIFTINNECFIKEKGEDCLISHNPKYPNIAGTKDIRCIGEVLGKVTI